MNGHTGAHPRIGAVDVIPFTPIRNITMEECVRLAQDFGARYNARRRRSRSTSTRTPRCAPTAGASK